MHVMIEYVFIFVSFCFINIVTHLLRSFFFAKAQMDDFVSLSKNQPHEEN